MKHREENMSMGRLLAWVVPGLVLVLAACGAPTAQVANTDAAGGSTAGEYFRAGVLVDTAWVLEHLDNSSVRFLDLSKEAETFEAGHLPGAQYVAMRTDLTNLNDPTEGQIVSRDGLSELLSGLGIAQDDTLVLYDDSDNVQAARAYWVLKYYQHEDVRIYNGGSKKWLADGQELTTEAASYAPTEYVANAPDPDIRTTWDHVIASLDDPETLFCDTRRTSEYIGVEVRADRGGHIPGAIHVEWTEAVNSDGTFRSAAELEKLYREAGFDPDRKIIAYCQTGVRSAHTWFVMHELLGWEDVRNYDGSWREYGDNPDSPIQ
jgi:thiosulfate/3-mercaptopyruvate sulfurtransferase